MQTTLARRTEHTLSIEYNNPRITAVALTIASLAGTINCYGNVKSFIKTSEREQVQ